MNFSSFTFPSTGYYRIITAIRDKSKYALIKLKKIKYNIRWGTNCLYRYISKIKLLVFNILWQCENVCPFSVHQKWRYFSSKQWSAPLQPCILSSSANINIFLIYILQHKGRTRILPRMFDIIEKSHTTDSSIGDYAEWRLLFIRVFVFWKNCSAKIVFVLWLTSYPNFEFYYSLHIDLGFVLLDLLRKRKYWSFQ